LAVGGLLEKAKELKEMHETIQSMKAAAESLIDIGSDFPAICCNTARIMASIKMLEINVSDLMAIEEE
jgi:aspartate/glutamate racemase